MDGFSLFAPFKLFLVKLHIFSGDFDENFVKPQVLPLTSTIISTLTRTSENLT